MKFRIGINVGDVLAEDGNLYGDGVNIAARLEALAEPGGICLSGSVHEHVERKLLLQYVDVGLQTLKNIGRPIRAYRIPIRQASGKALSITAVHTFATYWLVPRLGTFQTAHPDLDLTVEAMRRVVDFTREPVHSRGRQGWLSARSSEQATSRRTYRPNFIRVPGSGRDFRAIHRSFRSRSQ
ncbi:LysR substrate-binding domain-containing protein [Rhizobium sp. LjRoot258]